PDLQPPGEQRGADARDQQRADRQREVPHVHPATAYGAVSSSSPSTPALLTAGLAGATDTRPDGSGPSSSAAAATGTSRLSQAASASGSASTHGMRSWTGAPSSLTRPVTIAAPVPSYNPATAYHA